MKRKNERAKPPLKDMDSGSGGPVAEAERLLDALSRLLGVNVCFHDRLALAVKLPKRMKYHFHPACLHVKRAIERDCVLYDWHDTHRELAANPDGRINRCPGGFVEIAVPVLSDGLFAGVLFAGPLLQGPSPRGLPKKDLPPRAPSAAWLEDCRRALLAVAARLGMLLHDSKQPAPADRRQAILSFVAANYLEDIAISSLAAELRLSCSRTGHLVRALFRMSFPELVNSFRLRNAAGLLLSSSLPMSEIALKSGFQDQNYFARRFKLLFGMTPSIFRRRRPPRP